MSRSIVAVKLAWLAFGAALFLAACSGDDNVATSPLDGSMREGGGTGSDADTNAEAGLVQPPVPLTGAAAQGWQFAQQRKCPMCHQPADPALGFLSGQDTPRTGTMSYGSNLTPDPDTGLDGWDAPTLARSLRTGVDDQGRALCPPMPQFANMTDDEANAIAAFLQVLPAVHHDIPASVCASDAGRDASEDAAADAGADAGVDAGLEGGADAGVDAALDGGPDSASDGAAADASSGDAAADGG